MLFSKLLLEIVLHLGKLKHKESDLYIIYSAFEQHKK